MINVGKLEHKPTKTSSIARQKTFDNQSFLYLDKDISEMDVNIKRYETIKKKNSFLGEKSPIKKETKLKNKIYRINTYNNKNIKINDCYSITTSSSNNDKNVKKVTFSTVEIIRVEKYKKYNALNNYSKIDIEKNIEEVKNNPNDDETTCFVF